MSGCLKQFLDKLRSPSRGETWGFPDSSVGKESTCNAGDPRSIPGSGRFSGEGISYPLQYSCLGNPMDRGAWWATVHGVAKELDTAVLHTLCFLFI